MSKHTPGPWFAAQPDHCNGWWIVSADEEGFDCIDDSGDGGFSEANARLISAAPDLLKALEEADEWIGEYISQMRSYTVSDKAKEFRKKLHSAIAKATGEQQ